MKIHPNLINFRPFQYCRLLPRCPPLHHHHLPTIYWMRPSLSVTKPRMQLWLNFSVAMYVLLTRWTKKSTCPRAGLRKERKLFPLSMRWRNAQIRSKWILEWLQLLRSRPNINICVLRFSCSEVHFIKVHNLLFYYLGEVAQNNPEAVQKIEDEAQKQCVPEE